MFCTKCGAANEDNAKFCTSCGSDMTAEATAQPVHTAAQPANTYAQPYSAPNPYAQTPYVKPVPKAPKVLSENPVLNTLKTHGSSVLFLIAAILYSVMVLFQFIGILSNLSVGSNMAKELNEISPYVSAAASPVIGILSAVAAMSGLFQFIGMTPTVLILIGLWMFWANSKKPEDRKTTGMTLAYAGTLIRQICLFIALGSVFIGSIILAAVVASEGSASYGNDAAYRTSAIVIFLLPNLWCWIANILPLLRNFAIMRATKSVKSTLMTGVYDDRRLMAFAVYNFIFAGCQFIGLFFQMAKTALVGGLVNSLSGELSYYLSDDLTDVLNALTGNSGLSVFITLISIAFLIVIGICAVNYRKAQQARG